jgi:hypothetical protein
MLEHEIHERLHARGKMPAAHVVHENACGLRHALRQHGPQRARAKQGKNEGKGSEHQSLTEHCCRDERRDVVGQKVPADGGLLRLPFATQPPGRGLRIRTAAAQPQAVVEQLKASGEGMRTQGYSAEQVKTLELIEQAKEMLA